MSDTDAPETPPQVGPQQPLEPQQALQILAEVGAAFKGDLAQHQMIQRALQSLSALVQSVGAASNGSVLNREQRRRGPGRPKSAIQEATKE